MPEFTFDPQIKEVLDSFLLDDPEVEPGKAFGMPAYYVNGKMFAGVFGDGATIKVPAETAAELLERDGVDEFQPMAGRTMKNWVIIRHDDPADYEGDKDLFSAAFDYVYALTKAKK
ncbi:MAG TPA: TfoX/Sxy family protein [Candidatus Anoxymicrobiaceae bacterium]|jgi:TfoX N-terminal domain